MAFDPTRYGAEVQTILSFDGYGMRPMPLAGGTIHRAGVDALAGRSASELFAGARSPEAALSGLLLYFCAYDEAHRIAQDVPSAEGSFWHGILHRQEPDPGNAAYWFRRVGQHAIFPELREAADSILRNAGSPKFHLKDKWNPFAFIDYCEDARQKPGSADEETAMAIQLAEWQLLFDFCARPVR